MGKLEIGEQGQVTVAAGIDGTHEDPTLPLPERVRLLAEEQDSGLLREAADHLASQRRVAERRGNTQAHLQQQIKFAREEINFLRSYIREHCGKDPDFFIPVG